MTEKLLILRKKALITWKHEFIYTNSKLGKIKNRFWAINTSETKQIYPNPFSYTVYNRESIPLNNVLDNDKI